MTEPLSYAPDNPEDEPRLPIHIGEVGIEATRLNSKVYTFLGRLAVYDHIFIISEIDGKAYGTHIWKHFPVYQAMLKFMTDNNYPAELNSIQVEACDYQEYVRTHTGDLDNIEKAIAGWGTSS